LKYRVHYRDSGLGGLSEKRVCGVVEAKSVAHAKDIITLKEYPIDEMYGPNNTWSAREFFWRHLWVEEVQPIYGDIEAVLMSWNISIDDFQDHKSICRISDEVKDDVLYEIFKILSEGKS